MSPAPTWIPWSDPSDRCDACKAPAVAGLVRLDPTGTYARDLIRLACAQHRGQR